MNLQGNEEWTMLQQSVMIDFIKWFYFINENKVWELTWGSKKLSVGGLPNISEIGAYLKSQHSEVEGRWIFWVWGQLVFIVQAKQELHKETLFQ